VIKSFLRNALCVLCALSVSGCLPRDFYVEKPVPAVIATVLVPVVATAVGVKSRLVRMGENPYTKDIDGLKAFEGNFQQGRYYKTELVECKSPFGAKEERIFYIFDGSQKYKICYVSSAECKSAEYRLNGDNVYWMEYAERTDSLGQLASGSKGDRYNVFEKINSEQKTYIFMAKLAGDCYKQALVRFAD